jgi:hypothetical protein
MHDEFGDDENEFTSSFTPELKSARTEEDMEEVSVLLPDCDAILIVFFPGFDNNVLLRVLAILFLLTSSEDTESDPDDPDWRSALEEEDAA